MSVTLLTIPQTAARLGVSERTVWRRIDAGLLSIARRGRRVLVRIESTEGTENRSGGHVAETAEQYGASRASTLEPGPWPYTRENVERQRRRLLARRQAAFAELERLAGESSPDPDGLTVIDYLRDIRDPDASEPVD
ncbi:MAG TPA: helix-turn-helix domain-containing protein [Candidatus Limnocylindrales bacterium]|nr:helix-turn-helix domain-containing protein [Candidatus Limnocylindrales bacterium]